MKPWKNVSKFDVWSAALWFGVFAGCNGGASNLSKHQPNEGVSRDESNNAPPHSITSQPTGHDGTAPTSEADAAAPVTEQPQGSDGVEPPLPLNGAPLYSDYVRLTHQQWENSVVANLRLDAPTGFLAKLTPDPVRRYSNNEETLKVVGVLAADYQAAAASIAERVATDADALRKVSEAREPATFIAEVGRRFYRRPLTSEERAKYVALYETGATLASTGQDAFAAGAQLLLEVWMQAPSFLYRVEHSEGALDGYEVATRLAYFLTDTTPSDALLAAAEAGQLDTADGVKQAASELLASDHAPLVFRRFHEETYGLGRLAQREFEDSFGLPSNVGNRLLRAAHSFFDRQLRENAGLRELFLSKTAFADPELAALYDVPPASADDLAPFTLADSRRGVFAQLPFLMLDSFGETPNAFKRGAMFSRHVLCVGFGDLPDQTIARPPKTGLTNREYSSQVVASEACTVCHKFIDPFGFAFENFDGLGRERAEDNGLPVDTTGEYPFAPHQHFADSTDLMAILAESPLAHDCYAKNLTEFALGRSLTKADADVVERLGALSLEQDASLTTLVTTLVASATFRSSGGTP